MSEETKTCPKCGVAKSRADFGINRAGRDGLQSYCRPCNNTVQRSYADRKRKGIQLRKRSAAFPPPSKSAAKPKAGKKRKSAAPGEDGRIFVSYKEIEKRHKKGESYNDIARDYGLPLNGPLARAVTTKSDVNWKPRKGEHVSNGPRKNGAQYKRAKTAAQVDALTQILQGRAPKRTKGSKTPRYNGHSAELPLAAVVASGMMPEVRALVSRMANGGITKMELSIVDNIITIETPEGGE